MTNQIHHPGHNPFATRFVRPGAVAYLFEGGCSADELVGRLSESGWWGQIVGPHGSGKTALVVALMPALIAARTRVISVVLHDGQRTLGDSRREITSVGRESLVVVDGYEQLSTWSKLGLKRHCRRRDAGLLVTAHADVGLPTVFSTSLSRETAQHIVARLLPVGDETIGEADVARAWQAHDGNLREALFDLYDLYERRRGFGYTFP
jgi:hypothetical protein